MKLIYKTLLILLCICSVYNCVEEIATEVDFEENIFIFGNLTNSLDQLTIQINKSTPISSNAIGAVNDAEVSLFTKNQDNSISLVTNEFNVQGGGVYVSSQIIDPIVGNYYYLEVALQDGALFRSGQELLKEPVNLTGISRNNNLVRAEFSDPEDEINHYLVNFLFLDEQNNSSLEEFELSSDVLFNGNENAFIETFDTYENASVTAVLANLNYTTYQFYLNVVAQDYSNEGFDDESGDPSRLFIPPPASLSGNIVNTATGELALGNFGVISLSGSEIKIEGTSGIFAFTHVNLINGISGTMEQDQTVVFDSSSEKVIDIFNSETKSLTSDIEVVDMQGKYMIPGLIEGHYHLASTIGEATGPGLSSMGNMFKQGITTIRDMAGNGTAILEVQQLGANSSAPLPKVYFASLIVGKDFLEGDPRVAETAGSSVAGEVPWFALLDDTTDAATLINNARNFGATALKLYSDISPANAVRVLEEAQRQDFPIWAHATLFNASPWDIAAAHSLSHADMFNYVTVTPVPTELESFAEDFTTVYDLASITSNSMLDYFDLLKQNNTILEPTLSIYQDPAPEDQEILDFAKALTNAAYQNGVKLGVGTDWANEDVTEGNFLLVQEMQLLTQTTGMSNIEVIKAATLHNATALGIEQEYGSIEINKKADLVILSANPLEDLENLKTVEVVVKQGVVHFIN